MLAVVGVCSSLLVGLRADARMADLNLRPGTLIAGSLRRTQEAQFQSNCDNEMLRTEYRFRWMDEEGQKCACPANEGN